MVMSILVDVYINILYYVITYGLLKYYQALFNYIKQMYSKNTNNNTIMLLFHHIRSYLHNILYFISL